MAKIKEDPQEFINKYRENTLCEFSLKSIILVLERTIGQDESVIFRYFGRTVELEASTFKKRCRLLSSIYFNIITSNLVQDCLKTSNSTLKKESLKGYRDSKFTLTGVLNSGELYEKSVICSEADLLKHFDVFFEDYNPDIYFEILWTFYSRNKERFKILSSKEDKDFILYAEANAEFLIV